MSEVLLSSPESFLTGAMCLIKLNGKIVWILDRIKTARGDDMVYYRNLNSNPSDVKTKVLKKLKSKGGKKW